MAKCGIGSGNQYREEISKKCGVKRNEENGIAARKLCKARRRRNISKKRFIEESGNPRIG